MLKEKLWGCEKKNRIETFDLKKSVRFENAACDVIAWAEKQFKFYFSLH